MWLAEQNKYLRYKINLIINDRKKHPHKFIILKLEWSSATSLLRELRGARSNLLETLDFRSWVVAQPNKMKRF